jgi:hypothetical protein
MQFEDGAGMLDFPSFGILKTYGEAMEAVAALDTEEHDYKTLALDTADWFEPIVWAQVCADNKWPNIETPGYGKGYSAANTYWREFLEGLKYLRDERGMTIIIVAHCKIKRFDSPETEPYDRYQVKLHDGAAAILQEFADAVFFANYRVSTVKTEAGFNKKVNRGVGGGDRLIYTEERPAFNAKNRWSMPASLPLDWNEVARCIPFYNQNAAPAAIVTE